MLEMMESDFIIRLLAIIYFISSFFFLVVFFVVGIQTFRDLTWKEVRKYFFLEFPLMLFFTAICCCISNYFEGVFSIKDSLTDILGGSLFEAILVWIVFLYFFIKQKNQMFIWVSMLYTYFYLEVIKIKFPHAVEKDGYPMNVFPSILLPYQNYILAFFLIGLGVYGMLKIRIFIKERKNKPYVIKEVGRFFIYLCISLTLGFFLSKNILLMLPLYLVCLPLYLSIRLILEKNRSFISLKDYFKYAFPLLVLLVLISAGHMNRQEFLNNLSKLNPSHKEQNNEYANFPS